MPAQRREQGRNRTAGQQAGNPFGVKEDRFWNFIPATETKPPELLLYGAISSRESWWEDRVTPATFNRELAELGDVPEIVVRINSGGGDVFAANAIYTRLKDHEARITVKIDGWAASAATIIAMAGDTIKIARNGVFMIHDPAMTVWDTFRAEDFEKMAEELKVIKQSIVNTYAMKTGKPEQEIADLMAEEKWWTGDTAVENGFCDEIMFEESKTVIENANRIVVNTVPIDLSEYKTVPKALLNSPNNTGCITNKKPEEKEEKHMEPKNSNPAITTEDALKAAYPDLVANIVNAAKAEERKRIRDIKEMAPDGYDDIVEDAMFENPATAEAVAVKIIAAQKKQGGQYLANRSKDVESGKVNEVGAAAAVTGAETEDPFNAAIDKLFPEK